MVFMEIVSFFLNRVVIFFSFFKDSVSSCILAFLQMTLTKEENGFEASLSYRRPYFLPFG